MVAESELRETLFRGRNQLWKLLRPARDFAEAFSVNNHCSCLEFFSCYQFSHSDLAQHIANLIAHEDVKVR